MFIKKLYCIYLCIFAFLIFTLEPMDKLHQICLNLATCSWTVLMPVLAPLTLGPILSLEKVNFMPLYKNLNLIECDTEIWNIFIFKWKRIFSYYTYIQNEKLYWFAKWKTMTSNLLWKNVGAHYLYPARDKRTSEQFNTNQIPAFRMRWKRQVSFHK